MGWKVVLDLVRVDILRSRGVVVGQVCFVYLTEELHGCSMARKVIHSNIRDVKGGQARPGRRLRNGTLPDANVHRRTLIMVGQP